MVPLLIGSQRLIPAVTKHLGLEGCSTASPYAYSSKCIEKFLHGACNEVETHLEERQPAEISPNIFPSLLHQCVVERAPLVGKTLHHLIVEHSLEKKSVLDELLLHVYKQCGALEDVEALFATSSARSISVFSFLLQEYARRGRDEAANLLYDRMCQEAVLPNKVSYVSILSACATQKAFLKGKRIHSAIFLWNSGSDYDVGICTALMSMYGTCGCVDETRKLFDEQANRDVVCWTAMISIYANHGQSSEALQIFDQMQQDEARPNVTTFVSVLKACACLGCMVKGQKCHHWIYENAFELKINAGNVLIYLYSKCGSVEDAEATFKFMPKRDVATWNAMISLYASHRQVVEAVIHFVKMQENGFLPDKITFISLLPICTNCEMLVVGEWLHTLILDLDLESDIMVYNALLTMYGKCNCLSRTEDWFSQISSKGVATWNTLISVYIQCNFAQSALTQMEQMQHEGFFPDKVTFLLLLGLSASCSMLGLGKRLHVAILNDQLATDLAVGNALTNMYSKCGSPEDARRALDRLHTRDILSYGPIIEMLTEQGKAKQVSQMFEQLLQEALLPNKVTFVSMLSACANLDTPYVGRRMHAYIHKCGHVSDMVTKNALLSMHVKAGNWLEAQVVFESTLEQDRVLWNTLLTGYACNGFGHKVVQMFNQMQMEGEMPDRVTFLATMLAYGHVSSLQNGKCLHACIIGTDFCMDVAVRNALISMYGKLGSITDAHDIFNQVLGDNDPAAVSTWNAMISVYAHQEQGNTALQTFHQMQTCGILANPFTFVGVISACTFQLAVSKGIMLHACLKYTGFEKAVAVGNALVNMYGKWGNTTAAQKVFDNMLVQDVVSWTTLIAIYSQHGHIQRALHHYKRMQSIGLRPNHVTLLGILNGYSHSGLVEPCLGFLCQTDSALTMSDHFVSIIDLLVRAGQANEAEEIIRVMPFEPNSAAYMSLLAGCRQSTDTERGEIAARKVLELDPTSSAAHIMLSNVYAAGGREAKAKALWPL